MHYPIPFIKLLEDAVIYVIWKKKDIKTLFIQCGVSSEVIDGHDWQPMRRAISPILDFLNRSKTTKATLDKIIENMLAYNDGDHLLWMNDGKVRKAHAEAALTKLRAYIEQRESKNISQYKIQEARELNQKRIDEQRAYNDQLAAIKQAFINCSINENLQERGYQFEIILNELFLLFDLDPKKPFRRKGEQIDGAFIHGHTHFLLEAKWRKKPSDLQDLRHLDGKVKTSLDNTLGLFVSLNGFSQEALDNYLYGDRPKLICMDGSDIIYILEGQITLPHLLARKRDCAAHHRLIYVPAHQIIAGHY